MWAPVLCLLLSDVAILISKRGVLFEHRSKKGKKIMKRPHIKPSQRYHWLVIVWMINFSPCTSRHGQKRRTRNATLPYVAVPFPACVSKHPPIMRQDKLTASPRFLEFCQHQQGRGELHVKVKKRESWYDMWSCGSREVKWCADWWSWWWSWAGQKRAEVWKKARADWWCGV